MKNWIAVASAEHARRGRDAQLAPQAMDDLWAKPRQAGPPACGYMQVCHGKLAPIRRVQPGDRVAYYAPTITMGGRDTCQSFVSIGVVLAGQPYAFRDAGPPQGAKAPSGGSAAHSVASVGATFDLGGGFVPYRRDVAYIAAQEAPILPMLDEFEFVENRQRWGYKFRFGLFDVSDHDMRLIATAMAADPAMLRF